MPQKQDLTPLLDVRQNQLNIILNYAESLDNKNLAILAANVAVLLFAAQSLSGVSLALEIVIFLSYSISILVNLAGILPLGYKGASIDIDRHPEYLSMAEDDLILQLLSDTQQAISHNRRLNTIKLYLWLSSAALSLIGTFLLIWGIL
jgi:hypothetical protein